MIPGFRSVTKSNPCPICGKPDWCLVAKDGSRAACQRKTSAVPFGQAGFLHSLTDAPAGHAINFQKPEKPVEIDAVAIHARYKEAITRSEIEALALNLGVEDDALVELGVGRAVEWCDGTYSFPMRDGLGKIIGIRLRNLEGHKWAVYGSKAGLFFNPDWAHAVPRIMICEGPTSAAAGMTIGIQSVGRASNTSATNHLVDFLRARKTKPEVIVMSEMDGKDECAYCENNYCLRCHPGQVGADKVAETIGALVKTIAVIDPPIGKDIRDWLRAGAKYQDVLDVVCNSPTWQGETK